MPPRSLAASKGRQVRRSRFNRRVPGDGARQLWLGITLSSLILGFTGCAGPTVLERDFGQAWVYNQAVQIANPEAGLNPAPATGLAPKAAANTLEAYEKGFAKKEAGGGGTTINLSPMTTGGK
jgi:hypothetical protein